MKKLFLTLLCIFTLGQSVAQEKLTLSLNEAIEMGLAQNFDQQILEISQLSSQEDLAQSKRDLLPNLNANLNQGISNVSGTGNYSINSSVTLWSGGVKTNTIRRTKMEVDLMDEQIIQEQNRLAISIINTYLTAMMNTELHRYQASVLEISAEQALLGESRFKVGDILESDYLILKAQAVNDENALANSRIERDNAIIELKNLLVIDDSVELSVTTLSPDLSIDSLPMPTLEELIDATMAWLPELEIARISAEIAQKNVEIAEGGLMPTLTLNGSVGTNYNSLSSQDWGAQFTGNNVNSLSLSLNIPIWDNGQRRSNVKQMDYVAQKSEIEMQKTEFELRNSLEKEYNTTLAMEERTKATKQSSDAYAETFRVFSAQFTEDAISATQLLEQQNNYLTSLNNYLQTKYNYILLRKILDVYMGVEITL